jgi:hypothetical protein
LVSKRSIPSQHFRVIVANELNVLVDKVVFATNARAAQVPATLFKNFDLDIPLQA